MRLPKHLTTNKRKQKRKRKERSHTDWANVCNLSQTLPWTHIRETSVDQPDARNIGVHVQIHKSCQHDQRHKKPNAANKLWNLDMCIHTFTAGPCTWCTQTSGQSSSWSWPLARVQLSEYRREAKHSYMLRRNPCLSWLLI